MNEALQKALLDCESGAAYLRGAMLIGSAVDALVILPMIRQAAELARDIRALQNAKEADK